MKRLLAAMTTAAQLAIGGAGVAAAQAPGAPPVPAVDGARPTAGPDHDAGWHAGALGPAEKHDTAARTPVPVRSAMLTRIAGLIGTNVIGAHGEDLGQISNFLIGPGDQVRAAVIGWSAGPGTDESARVVPIEKVQLGGTGDERPHLDMTSDELRTQPRFEDSRVGQYASLFGWGEGIRRFQ